MGAVERPSGVAEAAEIVAACDADGRRVQPCGGGTKLGWGNAGADADVRLSTAGLSRILEHNAGDLTAVLEAGTTLAVAQEAFAEKGQRVALDPPLGEGDAATIGGVVATGDSGPLRHRFGSPRDLVLGVTMVLSDGTVARAGGKVIKNVAGYDLAKLVAGSYGTLGLIAEVVVRLQPLPAGTATTSGSTDDPAALRAAVRAVSHAPLEPEALDVSWSGDQGAILARFGGMAAARQAEEAAGLVRECGLQAGVTEDGSLWDGQRARQRSSLGTVVRVSSLASRLEEVVGAVRRAGASLAGRAALGLYWLGLPPADASETVAAVDELRAVLRPAPCTVLDAPAEVRAKLDVWGAADEGTVALMHRVKARFDPRDTFNPGIYVGGI